MRVAQLPTVYFGPDAGRMKHPKVFIRALLYSTASRGTLIEGMFVRLRRGDSVQTFPVWVYGSGRGQLARGAGVLAPQMGVAADHHFLLPSDGTSYTFLAGIYHLDLFAVVANKREPALLTSIELAVTADQAKILREDPSRGLYFDWGPDTRRYIGDVKDARPSVERTEDPLLAMMGAIAALPPAPPHGPGRELAGAEATDPRK